jgi:FRG domain
MEKFNILDFRAAEIAKSTINQPTSWEGLLSDFLTAFSYKQGFVDKNPFMFRGQGDSNWPLQSKLGRAVKKLHGTTVGSNLIYETSQLEGVLFEHFYRNAGLFSDNLPAENDKLGWLTLMQHHGAPTRLLDWSWSPFVALYMAIHQEPNSDTKNASIYILHYYALSQYWSTELWDQRGPSIWNKDSEEFPVLLNTEKINNIIKKAISDPKEYLPIPVRPINKNQRYRNQQSVLTLTINELASINEPMQIGPKIFPESNYHQPLFQKIVIPIEWRNHLLRALTRMGITHSSMFPALDGLGFETSMMRYNGFQH